MCDKRFSMAIKKENGFFFQTFPKGLKCPLTYFHVYILRYKCSLTYFYVYILRYKVITQIATFVFNISRYALLKETVLEMRLSSLLDVSIHK